MTTTQKHYGLTPRQGKSLRYVVSVDRHRGDPVPPEKLVVLTPWSDLPHTVLSAGAVLKELEKKKLIIKDDGGYRPTPKGKDIIEKARERGLWNK